MFFYLYTSIFGNLYLVVRRPMLKYIYKFAWQGDRRAT